MFYIHQYNLMQKIEPSELLCQAWQGKEKVEEKEKLVHERKYLQGVFSKQKRQT